MRNASRAGPLTISIGNTLEVVVVNPKAFHSGRRIASIAATTCGNAAGSTPAIAALTATSSTVAGPYRGGTSPSTSCGWCGVEATNSATRSGVAGSSGTPSPQPSASDSSYNASGSAATSITTPLPTGR